MVRPAKLSERSKLSIAKRAHIEQQTAFTITRELKLSVSLRRVQQILQKNVNPGYIKRLNNFFLTGD